MYWLGEGRRAIHPARPPLIHLDAVSKSFGALRVIDAENASDNGTGVVRDLLGTAVSILITPGQHSGTSSTIVAAILRELGPPAQD